MFKKANKNELRKKRHLRVRSRLNGTPERPRLNVYRSTNNIYVQVIDDSKSYTIVSASTIDKELKSQLERTGNKEAAKAVGTLIAKRALEKGVSEVVFDRGGYLYHGRVKELADAAREAGLKF